MNERDQTIARVVEEVVAYYRRRAPWASAQDMRQEAWAAALWGAQRWDGTRPLAPLVAVCARRWVAAWLIKSSSPVSASHDARHQLIGTRGADVGHVEMTAEADERVEDREWRVRVTARLLELAEERGIASLDELIAELARNPVRPFREVREQLAAFRADPELRELWNVRDA